MIIATGAALLAVGLVMLLYGVWLGWRGSRVMPDQMHQARDVLATTGRESGQFGVSTASPEGRRLRATRRAALWRRVGVSPLIIGAMLLIVGLATR